MKKQLYVNNIFENKVANFYKLILEQGLFDEEGDEEPAGEEAGEEAPAEAEEEPAGEEEPVEEEEEEEPAVEVNPEEYMGLAKSIDDELEAVFIDYEERARKAAAIGSDEAEITVENLLFEDVASDIDLSVFASNVARLLKNYTNLLDIEAIILNKAKIYLDSKYGKDTVNAFEDIMTSKFDIDMPVKQSSIEDLTAEVPIAVGASPEAAGAG